MTKKFNPFREALVHLYTPHDLDRGEVPELRVKLKYICWCLSCVCDQQIAIVSRESHINQNLCNAAIKYVTKILGKSATVERWLEKNCWAYVIWQNNAEFGSFYDMLQAYRWRWLNHMADQYDAGIITLDTKKGTTE